MRYTRQLMLLGLALAGCLAAAAPAQAKPPAGINIDVKVGYDGWVQLGRINPVVVDLDNASKSLNLSGDLVLRYNDVEYVTRLDLPAPSRKRFYLYFPCDDYPPLLSLIVRTKAYTEQFSLYQLYKTTDSDAMTIVVLTQQSGSLGVVNQLPTVRLYRDLYRGTTSKLGSSTSSVSYFNLDQLDANPKFFARADCIVLADIDYQQVTPELAEALSACVSGGKHVIFSLGLNGYAVASSALAGLCPLQVTGTAQVSDLGSFGRHYGIKTNGAPATFAVGSLAPGARASESSGTYPAVVRQLLGSGTVTALAFDYAASPFKQNAALGPLFADLALGVAESVAVTNWFVHPEQIGKILLRFSEGRPMQPAFVFLFLLSYIVLIGPLNFLILTRLKRRTLVWTTIPLIIAAFTYFGLSTGYFYRGSDNVTAYFQELHVFPGASYVPYQTEAMVFTAERTTYKLEVPDASAFLYPDLPAVIPEWQMGGNPKALRGVSFKLDDSKLPTVTASQGKWTTKQYFYQGYLGLPVKVSANLKATRGEHQLTQIEGDYTLDLPFDLYDCYLFDGFNRRALGDISGKGTFTLTDWQLPSKRAGLSEDNYLVLARSELAQQQVDCSRLGMVYRDELLLVGFTESVEALAKFDRPHKEYRLSMVVVHLPYRPIIPQSGKLLITRSWLAGGSGFELADLRGGMPRYNSQEQEKYRLNAGSYLDASYEIAGELVEQNNLLLHLEATDAQGTKLEDLSTRLTVQAWDGAHWRDIPVKSGSMALDIPLASLIDSARQIHVRFKCTADFIFPLPWADAY